jgi:CRISPR-associated protein Csb2
LEAARSAAEEKGKKPPAKLSAKDEAKTVAPFPPTLLQALLVDSATLRSQGWSQPPGSRWVSYWRPSDALSSQPRQAAIESSAAEPTIALLAVASDTIHGNRLPAFNDVVLRFDALHSALVRRSDVGAGSSWCFTGRTAAGGSTNHAHAELIPLCLGRPSHARTPASDGRESRRIDHILVHCRGGLDAGAVHALRTVTHSYAKDNTYLVTLVGLGLDRGAAHGVLAREREQLATTVVLLREARTWVSSTPFVPPRFLKEHGRNDLASQVRAELGQRGLPNAQIEVETRGVERKLAWASSDGIPKPSSRYRAYRFDRPSSDRKPPQRVGYHLRLTFEAPVVGPIALGYGSHFGLGVFEPK